jgi:hypothetical protein
MFIFSLVTSMESVLRSGRCWFALTPSPAGGRSGWISSTRWGLSMATGGDFHMAKDTR